MDHHGTDAAVVGKTSGEDQGADGGGEHVEDATIVDADVHQALVVDIYRRFIQLVLFARLGNGTWDQNASLTSFRVELPADDDVEFTVQINDEQHSWTAPRTARDIPVGGESQIELSPEDIVSEAVPTPVNTSGRFIRGVCDGERWDLEIRLHRPHPRRHAHFEAGLEFADAAARDLASGALRAFYENAFHAAEHLALAELFSYAPTAEELDNAKTHRTARSTYQLWARLENTDERFARLLGELDAIRPASTYLRGQGSLDPETALAQNLVLRDMVDWVRDIVENDRGPRVVRLHATRSIAAGELIGTNDLGLRPPTRRSAPSL